MGEKLATAAVVIGVGILIAFGGKQPERKTPPPIVLPTPVVAHEPEAADAVAAIESATAAVNATTAKVEAATAEIKAAGVTCQECNGKGEVPTGSLLLDRTPCPTCQGKGFVTTVAPVVTPSVPATSRAGTVYQQPQAVWVLRPQYGRFGRFQGNRWVLEYRQPQAVYYGSCAGGQCR